MKPDIDRLKDHDLVDDDTAARFLAKLTGQHITARMLEDYRSGKRARRLPFIRQFGGARGRVLYRVGDLRAFAAGQDGQPSDGRLLPPSWLNANLPAADLDHAHHLLYVGRRTLGAFGPVSRILPIDLEITAALTSLQRLVDQAGLAVIERLALQRLRQIRDGIAGATADDMVVAIKEVGAGFERQLDAWRNEQAVESAPLRSILARRQPLHEAVGKRLCALLDERVRTVRAREALGRGPAPAASLRADMAAAGVPAALVDQAMKAAGSAAVNISAEFDALNSKVGALGEQIEKLRSFALAVPGDYSALNELTEFDELVAAERLARGEIPADSVEAAAA